MDNFVSILNNSEISLEIKKSKFIGFSFFIENELEAQKIISNYCKQFADATHVCYAYVLNSIEKCSDNGEPSGTAGKPMLEIIKKMELKNSKIFLKIYLFILYIYIALFRHTRRQTLLQMVVSHHVVAGN